MKMKHRPRKKHGIAEIILTHENLHGCATQWGGFTRAQCQIMGVHWPPRRGWLRDLIGKRIPVEQFEQFREARLRRVQVNAKTLARYRERDARRQQRRAKAKAHTMNGDNPWLASAFDRSEPSKAGKKGKATFRRYKLPKTNVAWKMASPV
jgi:hypothetical protein